MFLFLCSTPQLNAPGITIDKRGDNLESVQLHHGNNGKATRYMNTVVLPPLYGRNIHESAIQGNCSQGIAVRRMDIPDMLKRTQIEDCPILSRQLPQIIV